MRSHIDGEGYELGYGGDNRRINSLYNRGLAIAEFWRDLTPAEQQRYLELYPHQKKVSKAFLRWLWKESPESQEIWRILLDRYIRPHDVLNR